MKKMISIIGLFAFLLIGCSRDNKAEKATSAFIKKYEAYVKKSIELNRKYYELYPKQQNNQEEFQKIKQARWDHLKEDSKLSRERFDLMKKKLWDKKQTKKYRELFMRKAKARTGLLFKKKNYP